jgi:PTS system nitrogen regulatory IIA component
MRINPRKASHRRADNPDAVLEAQRPLPGLEQAIRRGGIHYRVPGAAKSEVLAATVDLMRLPRAADRRTLLELLLARENLGSTAIGEGVAFPHARNPDILQVATPSITVCFLEHPVEFGALDGKPVHTLLAIISPTVRAHLHLLSLLSYGLRREEFHSAIFSRAAPAAILASARAVDEAVQRRVEASGR